MQRLHLLHQRVRTSAKLGRIDQGGNNSGIGGGRWAFEVAQGGEFGCQPLRLFVCICRYEIATKDNLVLLWLPAVCGGLCSIVRDDLSDIGVRSEGYCQAMLLTGGECSRLKTVAG